MNEQAVVIASYGASVPEAREGITAVEKVLCAAASGNVCVRAFTSPAIRHILKERGENIPSLPEALERLLTDGIRRVIIQPTHLLYGCEYDKLKAEAKTFTNRFASVTIGRPLLSDNNDIQQFALSLSRDHPAEAGTAVVLAGHGTKHPASAVYPALQTAFELLSRSDIYIGTLKGPSGLEDVLRQLESGGPRRIKLLPLMLTAGSHARNDIAGEWKSRLAAAGHTVSCTLTGLGQLDWVQEMYQERFTALLTNISG